MLPAVETESPPRARTEAERRYHETLAHASLFL